MTGKAEGKKISLREKLYIVIFGTDTPAGKRFDVILLIVILFSVFMAIIESVPYVRLRFQKIIKIIEWSITAAFTIEYILRIYCSPNRKKYIFSFYGIIDLLAILPSFISVFIKGTHYLTIIRSLRLLRIFRIFKLTQFLNESSFLAYSLKTGLHKILVFMYFVIIMVIILGSLMYVIEGNVNPSFSDIPKSIYWAVVTITTVGYGDITPITVPGQLLATTVMLLGYAIIAVPTGILSTEMIKNHRKSFHRSCPFCENKIHDKDAAYCKICGTPLPPPPPASGRRKSLPT